MKNTEPMEHTVAVRLPNKLFVASRTEAEIAGISVSDAIRLSLKSWCENQENQRLEKEAKKAGLKDLISGVDSRESNVADILEQLKKALK